MRVIAGSLGGRNFLSPKGHRTHPMSEKARGAIYNALGDIEALTVLDAFAGSGALGIEALSRGADSVVAVDMDRLAAHSIRENRKELGLEGRLSVYQQNISSWSDTNLDARFDIVLLDPPYDAIRMPLLEKVARHTKLNGLAVLSWPGSHRLPDLVGFEMVAQKPLGDIQLAFYRKVA